MLPNVGHAQPLDLISIFGLPKPGPEHDRLKEMEGVWDVTIDYDGREAKGTISYKMDLNGCWLVGKFDGEAFGQKFEGRSLDSYDSIAKLYVSIWVDSLSTRAQISEGKYDPKTKKTTLSGEWGRFQSTREMKDKDTMVLTMVAPSGTGVGSRTIKTTYKRKH
jgi:hypothetical protein